MPAAMAAYCKNLRDWLGGFLMAGVCEVYPYGHDFEYVKNNGALGRFDTHWLYVGLWSALGAFICAAIVYIYQLLRVPNSN